MPDEMPEPLATIARMRREGRLDDEIAAVIGKSARILKDRVTRWNTRYPEHRIPPAADSTYGTKKPKIIALSKAGLTAEHIAAQMGVTKASVARVISGARAEGLLPRVQRVYTNGCEMWAAHNRKGAAQPMGTMQSILQDLTVEQLNALLDLSHPKERTISATIARILKGHLDGNANP